MSGGRALVTGATSGIGREFARILAAEGFAVVLVARDRARLEALAAELGPRTEIHVADLATAEGVRSVEPLCADLDLLVNCAGVLVRGDVAEADTAELEACVALMVSSVIALTRAALPGMLARGRGDVLNVASRAAFVPESGLAVYCATKAAVRSFTVAVAREVAGTGVRVHVSCPGNTRTELHARAGIPPAGIDTASQAPPERVAREALASLRRGERVGVPGERALDSLLARLLPRRLTTKVAGVLARLARA